VAALLMFVDPTPPRTFTLLTGDPDGAYHAFGMKLATELKKQGLEVTLRSSKGSNENLALLASDDEATSIALVQSGLRTEAHADFKSLGSLFYEPLWVFTRRNFAIGNLQDLRGRRVAVGAEGSGTLPLALKVLDANGLTGELTTVQIGGDEATAALREGGVDAAVFVGSPQGAAIKLLIDDPELTFHGLRRERAYQTAFPNLATMTIGEGQLNLAKNIPPEDRVMLASVVSLVINDRFHPGLAPAVLEAASNLLRQGGTLERPGEFPAARPTDFPLLAEASHYHRNGPPFLMRFLPFWAATVAFRVFILIIPLLAILIPLLRVAPPLYQWRTRRRIFRWYSHLREIDQRLTNGMRANTIEGELEKLHELQDEILKVKVPLSYSDELYDLHLHVEWVIQRLKREQEVTANGS
ncbi:MAG TPA: TAXI family TRAP transporter solute-binding subunit, partial [Opitutus sp.]|nr:TAXI family TRAP transporter solute-binding subunit [Opitutus sp.]